MIISDERCSADELDLSIVIPAYKEGHKIERDIRAAHGFIKSAGLRAEIIVVDDGSPDDTAMRASALTDEIKQLRVLSYVPNRGKGHAIRFGMLRATGRNVMFADAGLCVPYEISVIGIAMLDLKMCQIAHGSRRMRGSVRVRQPFFRRIGSQGFAFLVHSVIGIPGYISDTQCGFKVYRGDIAKELYAEIFSDGFMFDIELILRIVKRKLVVLEFPVLWSNDADSRYDPLRGGAIGTLRQLWQIRIGLARNKVRHQESTVTERFLQDAVGASEGVI